MHDQPEFSYEANIGMQEPCDDILMLKLSYQKPDFVAMAPQAESMMYDEGGQYNDLGLKDYDFDEASIILNAQFYPEPQRKMTLEQEEIIKSHIAGHVGLKYAKMSTIKHWMTIKT